MPAAATEILPEIMRSFSQKYPQVRYEVFTSTADIIRERIDKGILDIGLLTEPVDLSRYDFLRLKTKDRWGVLTWRGYGLDAKDKVTMEDLKGESMLVPRRLEVQNNIANWFGKSYRDMQIYAVYNLIGNAAMIVQQKLCHALALECAATVYENRELCFLPLYPERETTSVLVWKKYQPASNVVRQSSTGTKR